MRGLCPDQSFLTLAKLVAALLVATLLSVAGSPALAQPADPLSVEELEQMLEFLEQQRDQAEGVLDRNNQAIEDIDGMLEDIDRTLEQYAPLVNAEPIPLLGVDSPVVVTALPAADDVLGFNAWCFHVLHTLGERHGYADALTRDLAGFAMSDARERLYRLSDAAGYDPETLQAFDRSVFTSTLDVAAAAAAGTMNQEQARLLEACRAKGVRGMRYKALYVDPVEGLHTKLWCASTFLIFDQRQMIGGGPERAARAKRALGALEAWLDNELDYIDIPMADRTALLNGYYFRSVAQVDAFNFSKGDKRVFEDDYETCFDFEDLRVDLFRIDLPTFPAARPSPEAAGWDYPISADFRFNAWCYGAMQFFAEGRVSENSEPVAQDIAQAAASAIQTRLLNEGEQLGLNTESVFRMQTDAIREARYELMRPWSGANGAPTSYAVSFCPHAAAGVGGFANGLTQVETLDEARGPEADFRDALWCIVALEQVLGSETDREKRAGLQQGIESLSNIAANFGRGLGLSPDVMMGQFQAIKPVVTAEIRTRRDAEGTLEVANCLDRGLGYHDVFYDWVEPD